MGLKRTFTEEHRRKLSEAAKKRYASMTSDEMRAHLQVLHRGAFTAETIAKANAARQGRQGVNKGRIWPPEVRVRMKIAKRKYFDALTPEQRKKHGGPIGHKHADESKRKMSISVKASWDRLSKEGRAARAKNWTLAGRRSSKVKTRIEKAIERLLIALRITYIYQQPIGRYVADFFVPDRMLVIECDGTYWHSRPGMAERDAERDAWMKAQGYSILRLPESDIKSLTSTELMRKFAC